MESRPVELAVVGLGFGRSIAEELRAQPEHGLRVAAVCDRQPERCRRVATALGVPGYRDLDEVLAQPGIEAVGLFTGPEGRGQMIRRIVASGRDVVTTKPFELDPHEARGALEAAAQAGRIVHLNSPGPALAGDVLTLRRWAEEENLGRPLFLRAETWAGYRESADGSWYDHPVVCAAAPLLRLGIYLINDFCPLLGAARTVSVDVARLRTGRPTPDQALATFRFESGAAATVFASFCVDDDRPYQDRVEIVYERGTLRRWLERPIPHRHAAAFAVLEGRVQGRDRPLRHVCAPGDWAGHYQWARFAAAVRSRARPEPSNLSPVVGVGLLAAINRAAISGRAEVVMEG